MPVEMHFISLSCNGGTLNAYHEADNILNVHCNLECKISCIIESTVAMNRIAMI